MIQWRKSSYSGGSSDEACVEVARVGSGVGVRDSRDPDGPRLAVSAATFAGLLERVRLGDLDR
ncbi:DUF397 domain-containing protein [Actinomadura logoneensis]|uniref:DUF397 domain-containing protein n=1 Tax=Actinomadura logoneensis TaxID=2293572 RepID=A0A372JNK9_9ACTN|nr:DUF397 domain-containing protein [Actinomadura logoneensis]RFU41386.1 DUF397 domain-containing protein [Actinomadura logoneensis]